MNYWPAQSVGLPECAQPLRDFVEALSVHGRRTAREQYGLGGWVAHHQADGHLQATPVGYLPQGPIPNSAQWALWSFGGAWLASSTMKLAVSSPGRDRVPRGAARRRRLAGARSAGSP